MASVSTTTKLAFTIPEAVAASGVSRRTLYRYITTRELPHVKVGNRTLIRSSDLESFLDSRVIG